MSDQTQNTTQPDRPERASPPFGASVGWRSWLTAERWEQSRFGLLFGADLRSLALLRMVLALVVLKDLVARWPSVRVHYTDEGVMPRSLLVDSFVKWRWSVNLINDTYEFQAFLILLTMAVAVAVLVGYRTRLMVVLVWVLVVSLQVRNPYVLSGADTLVRLLLFWSMFLPLGAVWSVDAARRQPPITWAKRTLSFATIGIFLQISFMYWFTAILKSGPEWRTEGTALYYALGAEHITKPFGEYLHQFPELLRVMTHASLGLEIVAPILLFFPFWNGPLRTFAVASVMAFHFGIYVTMDVGIFPWTSALCMVCFLPTWFWDSLVPRITTFFPDGLRRWGHQWESSLQAIWQTWVPVRLRSEGMMFSTAGLTSDQGLAQAGSGASVGTQAAKADTREPSREMVMRAMPIANLFLAGCLALVLFWNVTTVTSLRVPSQALPFGYASGLYQKWNMFAPTPSKGTVWIVVRGVLADGREIDLLTPIVHDDLTHVPALSWTQPGNIVNDYYGDKYWRKYLTAIGQRDNKEERRSFAAYACRTWNAYYGGDVRLVGLQVFKMSERTLPDYEDAPTVRSKVAEYRCR